MSDGRQFYQIFFAIAERFRLFTSTVREKVECFVVQSTLKLSKFTAIPFLMVENSLTMAVYVWDIVLYHISPIFALKIERSFRLNSTSVCP
jgi:hypothetical protein